METVMDRVWTLVTGRLPAGGGRPLTLGLCGAQGSGKTTLADALARRLRDDGRRVAVLSLDDLYLTHEQRQDLARDVHPLLATRGVPGTHDVALGLSVLDALAAGRPVTLPRFDKAADTRRAAGERVDGPVDVVLLEGWCVGARPQDAAALANPVNALERDRDPDGRWRCFVNDALAGPYQALFARLDALILLAAPDFAIVRTWRTEQEARLRQTLAAEGRGIGSAMTDDQIAEFIQHYERLTRHILADMPSHADLTLRLDAQRRLLDGSLPGP